MGKGAGDQERVALHLLDIGASGPPHHSPAAAHGRPATRDELASAAHSGTQRGSGQRRTSWSDERIRAELAPLLVGQHEFPSQADLRAAGQVQLLSAVLLSGGVSRWAAEFGLPVKRPGRRRVWTDQRIERRLTELLADRTTWPTQDELAQLEPGLESAMRRHPRGLAYWADRFGFEAPARELWTDERIRSELREFLRGRSAWPTQREFRLAGRGRLLSAVYGHGGAHRWAAEFGMTVRPHGRLG